MALSADALIDHKENGLISVPVKANVKIYKGAIVKFAADGYAAPAATEANAHFAGIAMEYVDNTGGQSGDVSVKLLTTGVHKLPLTSSAISDNGSLCYAATDALVQVSAGSNLQLVGQIVGFPEAGYVDVDITKRVAG